jgi:hypothetical protein
MVISIFIAASERASIFKKEKGRNRARGIGFSLPRLRALQGSRNTRVFEDQRALSLVLEEKDPLLAIRAFRIRSPLDEKSSLLVVEPSVAVHLHQSHR